MKNTKPVTQPQEPTLVSVEEAFAQWRKQKKPREKIPNQLWELVRQLMGRYKISKIMVRLSINTSQLKKAGLISRPVETKCNSKPFVNIELSSVLPTNNNTHTLSTTHQQQLILERDDGKRLIVNNPSENQTTIIIQQFWG